MFNPKQHLPSSSAPHPRPSPPPPHYRAKASSSPLESPVTRSVFQKRRTILYTGAVAVITVAGAWIGATIKTNRQIEEKKTELRNVEADTAAQITMLEQKRAFLIDQELQLTRKMDDLKIRRQRKAALEADRQRTTGGGQGLGVGVGSGPGSGKG